MKTGVVCDVQMTCLNFSSYPEVDPCVEGREECGENSQCVVDGDIFR